jgi:hypothetical protein
MVDKRCPMCGKPNPPDAEVCRFCQARLTPVNSTSPGEGSDIYPGRAPDSKNDEDLGENQSDWLRSLRGDVESEPESNQEIPDDWLSGFRDQPEEMPEAEEYAQSSSSTPATPQVNPESAVEPEDWLRSMLPEEDLKEADESVEMPEDDSDWLSRIGTDADQLPSTEMDKEIPDWLSSMEETSPEIGPASIPDWFSMEAEEKTAPDEELPDWLSGEGAGVPEWMTKTQEEKPVDSSSVQSSEDSEAELPDWLSRTEVEPPTVPPTPKTTEESEPELPDWLSQAEGEEPGIPLAPQAPEESEPELPDWLGQTEVEEPAIFPAPQAPEESEPELPDWLTQTGELTSGRDSTESSGIAQPGEGLDEESIDELPDWLAGEGEELPDWLTEAAGGRSSVAPTPKTPEESKPESPDWLDSVEQTSSAMAPVEDVEATQEERMPSGESEAELPEWLSGESEDLPDWLASEEFSGWASEEERVSGGTDYQVAPSDQRMPAAEPESEFEFPDWLEADLAEEKSQEQFTGSAAEIQLRDTGVEELREPEEDLTWLEELETAFPEMPSAEDVSTDRSTAVDQEHQEEFEVGYDQTLPDWLTGVGEVSEEEGIVETPPLPEEVEELDITPAKLPSWLEAMRPVGMAGEEAELEPEISGRPVEGAGPLAGLRGVLPAEPDISQTVKPPVYTVKLQVTDLQKTQAELLSRLIEQEGTERPVPGRPIITTQHVLRLVIAALLILAILLPITTGLPQTASPAIVPEVSETSQLIGDLPAAAPVLLAVDYEPGLSGEMDAISSPVLDHLMIKGAFLTLVSTTPTGAMQAENLIAQVNRRGGHQYVDPNQYVNMGFIPGGTMGLLAFVEKPREILPVDLNGDAVWGNAQFPALQNINSLADFSMIIVATENPDTARAWIEQVQPRLVDKPMILLLSAQAEPMVRPYYAAAPRQVQGLVSGLAAGASYEALLGGRRGSASQYWPAFSLGMLVAALLIISGGLLNAVSTRLRKGREGQEGEK